MGISPPIIVVSAGHGDKNDGTFDQGAYDSASKTTEHSLNVKVRDYTVKELRKYNCIVISDNALLGKAHDPNWSAIAADYRQRNFKPTLLIDIHHDSPNARKAGFGILPRTIFKGDIAVLCELISDEYERRGLPTKPSYSDVRGLGLLKIFRYPTAIWECNVTEMVGDNILQARGEAIARGIVRWKNIPAGPMANSTYSDETIYKARTYLGLNGHGGQDKEFVSALVAWKKTKKFYPSAVLADFHLVYMGIEQ